MEPIPENDHGEEEEEDDDEEEEDEAVWGQIPSSSGQTRGRPILTTNNNNSTTNGVNLACKHSAILPKSVKKEIFLTEKVESTKRTIPGDRLVDFESRHFDSSLLGPPEMSSTAYKYSYESCDANPESFDQNPGENDQDYYVTTPTSRTTPSPNAAQQQGRSSRSNGLPPPPEDERFYDERVEHQEQELDNGYFIVENDERINVERQQKQTKKVTRVTKVTTTRTIQHMPVDQDGSMGGVEYHISAPGYANGCLDHYGQKAVDGRHSRASGNDAPHSPLYTSKAGAPSSPGVPQIVDIDADRVTIVWLRPEILWTPTHHAGRPSVSPFFGYQVQYRPINDPHWYVANEELILEPLCTIEHLQCNGEYEIRVAAKNAAGFGPPSQPVSVQLRPANQAVTPTEKVRLDSAVPSPPGQPRVVECDGHNAVRLIYEPPVYSGSGSPVHGYKIEYRVASSTSDDDDWITATDRLTTDNVYTITGLRPNGDYEFRVLAKNLDGFSEPSRVSDVFRIRPFSEAMALNCAKTEPIPVSAPGQPNIVEFGADWVTINWPPSSVSSSLKVDRSNIHFLIECRQKGDPTWCLVTEKPIFGTQFTIVNLHKNSAYEFRVIARNNRGDQSQPSKPSLLCHLSPKLEAAPSPVMTILRQVPPQPRPPEIVSVVDDCVTLQWSMEPSAPLSDQQRASQKSAPLQGFQVEFRELSQPPSEWLAVNAILTHSCKMTVGDLEPQRRYEFRVTAKNAIGYSKPSDPSQSVFIGALTPVMESATPPPQITPNGLSIVPPPAFPSQKPKMPSPVHRDYSFNNDVPLPVEMSPAKESPPITDTDDSPPPIRRKPPGADGVTYRDPTLSEVLDYLGCNNNVLKLNASGYLQHLTYNELAIKHKVRKLDGIPRVVDLLRNEVPEIQKNACGCLRNLCYGIDENKKAILNAGGVPALANLLRKTPDMQILEEISSVLWNLSSYEDLKLPVLESCADLLVKQIVVPYSGWSPDGRFTDHRQHPPAVFRNAVGVLRNVSSAGDGAARQTLRERPGLVDALCHYLHMSCDTGQVDAKSVENVICVIRNLTYRLQEMEDANYDKKSTLGEKSKSAPSSPKSAKKKTKQKKQRTREFPGLNDESTTSARHPLLKQPATGISLLWQPEVVRDYLKLLDQSSNPDTLEGSAGAIQNLAACYWQPSVDVRATVRKEKGLPILVALLSVDSDKVVCASATALRNLSLDQRNKELIGKYAMEDLVKKLPPPSQATLRPSPPAPNSVSDETAAAVLSVVYATTVRSPDFTRTFLEKGGVERLVYLSNSRQYSHRVVKYSAQVLFAIWQHRELHDAYKKAGFREDDFVSRVGQSKNADTLARPVSTQGGAADKKRRSRQQEQSRSAGIRPDFDQDEEAARIEGGGSLRAAAIATPPRSNPSREYETLDARSPYGTNQGSPYSHRQQATNPAAYAQIQKKQTIVKQDLPIGQSTTLKAQNGKNSSNLTSAPQQPMDSWV